MTTVQFYHLTATPMERAVPKLVEKAYGAGFRVHLVLASPEQVDYMNTQLWTFDGGSFLPHGAKTDPHPELQPVYLSAALNEEPNGANLLFVTEGSVPPAPEAYGRILDLFDGNNPEAVQKARERWTQYKEGGHGIAYFKQTAAGGWEKAA